MVIKVKTVEKSREFICDACGDLIDRDIYFLESEGYISYAICQKCYEKYYRNEKTVSLEEVDEETRETINCLLNHLIHMTVFPPDDKWELMMIGVIDEIKLFIMKNVDDVKYALEKLQDYDTTDLDLKPNEWLFIWRQSKKFLDRVLLLKFLIDKGIVSLWIE